MNGKILSANAAGLLATLVLAGPAVASTIPYYRVTDLGSVSPNRSDMYRPTGINNGGAIVGNHYYAFLPRGAFLWTPQDGMMNLSAVSGIWFESASSISDAGRIAGSARIELNEQPVLWDSTTGVVELGGLGAARRGGALDVNENNQVVGWSAYDPNNVYASHAFLWDPVNGTQDLSAMSGRDFTGALAINESGQIAGIIRAVDGNSRPVVWDPVSGLQEITIDGLYWGVAEDINDAGAVVGQAAGSQALSEPHAFLYQDGTYTDLGALGRTRSDALAINSLGQIVGTAGVDSGTLGWVYDGQQMWNLNRLVDRSGGWIIRSANDINDAGQIVVTATRRTDPYREYALLLDPIAAPPTLPEPGTLGMLGLGLLGMTVGRRRLVN